MKVTIDRSKWRCGGYGSNNHGQGNTELLNREGYMCCLGFRCLAGGLHACDIGGIEAPSSLDRVTDGVKALLKQESSYDDNYYDESDFAEWAISINDDEECTRQEKEQRLIKLAAKYGEEWEFVGEYKNR